MHPKPFLLASVRGYEGLKRILDAGLSGVHPLFSNQMIRAAFERAKSGVAPSPELAEKLKLAVAGMLRCKDMDSARAFVQELEGEVQDSIVVMYFDFLDQYRSTLKKKEIMH